ncbi:phosphosulfolactate synthase [Robertmurraya massiliosenegalensis]|uniref:phosphosulfolactate synthase n=1 Tax=Robertmurraya massiliosenegalensis TaxID=1287657 RepID=UPI0002FE77CC|nr:phosphosulfolactate synthase [Robertmurraya massiliosenegalensis]
MDFLQLPNRTNGTRSYGLTSIVDFGTPIGELEHILKDYHQLIDIAKLGIGTAYVFPNLKDKVKLYQQYNIKTYCGGTLFEKCYQQNKIDEYLKWLKELAIDWLEVSNGTLNIPLQERLHLISEVKDDFHVIAEVGSKDSFDDMPISEWKAEMNALLEAGCQYVITEGRDSGTAGIYDNSGAIKSELIFELIRDIDWKKVIFEAPTPKHQMFFINCIGTNVNLGNVKISDVLILETQRRGLRSETFNLEEQEWKLPL